MSCVMGFGKKADNGSICNPKEVCKGIFQFLVWVIVQKFVCYGLMHSMLSLPLQKFLEMYCVTENLPSF